MATEPGNLSGITRLTESQFEDLMGFGNHQGYEYDITQLFLIPKNNTFKTLWTNPNSYNIMSTQFISIQDCSDYKFLIIWSRLDHYATSPVIQTKVLNPFYNGADSSLRNRKWIYTTCFTDTGRSYVRHLKLTTPTNILVQYGCYSDASGSPQYTEYNYGLIPIQICGSNII